MKLNYCTIIIELGKECKKTHVLGCDYTWKNTRGQLGKSRRKEYSK